MGPTDRACFLCDAALIKAGHDPVVGHRVVEHGDKLIVVHDLEAETCQILVVWAEFDVHDETQPPLVIDRKPREW